MELVLPVGLIVITALIGIFIGSWGSVRVRESGNNEVLRMIDVFTLPLNFAFIMNLISFLSEWDYHYLVIAILSCVLSSLIVNYFGEDAEELEDNIDDEQSKEKEVSIVSSKSDRLMVLTPWIERATIFQYVLFVVFAVSWYYSSSLRTACTSILFTVIAYTSIEKCLFLVATESKSSRNPKSSVIALAVKSGHEDIKIVSWPKMLLIAIIALLILAYLLNSFHWILSNITAIFTAIIGITHLQFKDVKACLLVECIFIVLDVIAVFGTNWMMNAVQYLPALTIKVPPRILRYSAGTSFIELGLGDIILPGIFASLLFSYEKKYHSNKSPNLFFVGMIGYSFGIFIAFAMAYRFNAMQPALLYINPLFILFAALFSLYRGELKQLINFSLSPIKKKD